MANQSEVDIESGERNPMVIPKKRYCCTRKCWKENWKFCVMMITLNTIMVIGNSLWAKWDRYDYWNPSPKLENKTNYTATIQELDKNNVEFGPIYTDFRYWRVTNEYGNTMYYAFAFFEDNKTLHVLHPHAPDQVYPKIYIFYEELNFGQYRNYKVVVSMIAL